MCAPGFATFQISNASLLADGTVSVTMNGTYTSGSTASCFVISAGTTAANGAATSVVASGGSVTVTLSANAPLYGEQSPVVSLAAAPTCLMIGSAGAAASSSSTMTTNTAANVSEWHSAGGSPMSTYARLDGSPAIGDQFGLGYASMVTWNSANGYLSVNVANATAIHIWAWHGNNAWCAQQDGVNIGTRQTSDASSAMSDFTLATGLSGTHLYRIFGCAGASAFQNVMVPAVRFVGGTLTGSIPVAKFIIGACGDSIVGSGSAPDDSRTVDWWLNSIVGGYSAQIYTASGALVSGGGLSVACGPKSLLMGGSAPDLWVLEGGVNDQRGSVATGVGSTFRVAMASMISTLQGNGVPPSHILVRGLLPNTATNAVNRSDYVTDQAAAASAAGVGFYHTDGWIDPTVSGACPNDTSDGLHPNGATSLASGCGYAKIANRQAPIFYGILNGHSFTVSGPSTSVSGSPSATFTATIVDPAVSGPTWQDIVTITSTNGSDQICVSGGSCGTGSVTNPGGLGTATFGFTVNAATAAARTISFGTSLPDGWVAPANLTLTSSAAPTVSSGVSGSALVLGSAR